MSGEDQIELLRKALSVDADERRVTSVTVAPGADPTATAEEA